MRFASIILLFSWACAGSAAADDPFAPVQKILERHCLSCHNDNDLKGGLSLATSEALLKGGDAGAAVLPGQPDKSEILEQISGNEPAMPKDRPALSKEEVAAVRAWIAAGAVWPEKTVLHDRRFDAKEWWSFQPLRSVVPPTVPAELTAEVRNPIDQFVLAELARRKLTPSPEADRLTLIRRVTFDLTGLPPTPQEIDAFLADNEPRAYERLVDRLLASPRYGERWARHWLDVVHFGETHGYDKDKVRENAWPYRDYVIRAFNEDRPYGQFIREQLAGDVLYPDTRDGLEGPGFIAAGPWDFIGHAEVPETKTDGKIARHLDRDDMITNTIQTFTSLTVQCAQCHDHKFDPILQEDYYSLQAVFAAVDRTDRKYDTDPAVARKRRELEAERTRLAGRLKEIEERIAKQSGPRWKELADQIASLEKAPAGKHPLAAQFGYHSGIASRQEETKWVQIELPPAPAISQIVLHPCNDNFNNIGDGFGFPVRYRIEVGSDAELTRNVRVLIDQTAADVANPGVVAQKWTLDVPVPAAEGPRFLRITATKLAPRLNDFIFALSEVDVLDGAGLNLVSGAKITSGDSIEAPPRWRRTNLVDGYFPGVTDQGSRLAELKDERDRLRLASITPEDKLESEQLEAHLVEVRNRISQLPPQRTSYVAAVHTGSGAFSGTGGQGGKPRPIHLLKRGSVQSPGAEVGPGAIAFLSGLPARFDIPAESGEGARRAALANWIAHPDHPLTWRSIVNRVWHYHFGRGIVETPNDFGRNGGQPTHPQLLDWLAARFRDGEDGQHVGGGSIKDLHRLIVTSRTYRQTSLDRPENATTDADNRYLWRMNRRRLDAESVRDSVLMISGKLNLEMYGPSFRDFVIEKPEHSPHYEYHLFDPNDPRGHRRSVYRFIVRSQPQPFMTTLDCADPSMQVDRRNESLSPLQALALLNNDLMLAMSEHFAARLASEHATLDEQVASAMRLAAGQLPTPDQQSALVAYAQEHGRRNACRVVMNLNAFLFVE